VRRLVDAEVTLILVVRVHFHLLELDATGTEAGVHEQICGLELEGGRDGARIDVNANA
jgi:hypothetical protein